MRKVYLFILICCVGFNMEAQEERKFARKGNKEYKKQAYEKAELSYRKALVENPSYPEGQFNLGDAVYQQARYEESIKPFEQILAQTESEEMKAWTHHNMGNAQLESKKYQEAIASYKDALRIRPDDMDTKYNLAYAQQMLKEQEQNGESENDQQNEDQNQEQQNQEQNQENQQDENEQNQEQEQNQDQQGNEEQENEQKQGEENQQGEQEQKQPRPNQLSKEEAERILQALQAEEEKVQAKVQKEKGKPTNIVIEKDW